MNISISISDDDELGLKALVAMKLRLKTTRQSLSNEFRNWLVDATTTKLGATLDGAPESQKPRPTNKARASVLARSLGKGATNELDKPKS